MHTHVCTHAHTCTCMTDSCDVVFILCLTGTNILCSCIFWTVYLYLCKYIKLYIYNIFSKFTLSFAGDYCEITITVPSTHNESLVMVIAISLCILLVIVTLVVVLCVFRQRRYRGKYNPAAVETVGGTAVPLSQMLAADTKEFLIWLTLTPS